MEPGFRFDGPVAQVVPNPPQRERYGCYGCYGLVLLGKNYWFKPPFLNGKIDGFRLGFPLNQFIAMEAGSTLGFFLIGFMSTGKIWLVLWNHGLLYDFPMILGIIISSQLTNSYFSEGLKPPSRIDSLEPMPQPR